MACPAVTFCKAGQVHQATRSIVNDSSTTGVTGLSWEPVLTFEILSATSWPSMTSPKMVWLPVSQSVGATVIKNWQPLV